MASTNGNGQARHRRGGFLHRCGQFLDFINEKFAYFVGLPIVTVVGTFLAAHFQYLSAYQDKVKEVGTHQVEAAEATFTSVSTTFSKAITLQQLLFFNYRDAVKESSDGDDKALETKNARSLYKDYDDLRTDLREHIDLLARRVEIDLDWATNTDRDAAHAEQIGADPMSRIALGAYNFDCDKDVPNFKSGQSSFGLPVADDIRRENPDAKPLGVDWYSAKHQLLTLYYCFDKNNMKIAAARAWAANSPVAPAARDKFVRDLKKILDSFDQEAIRLDSFITLGARRIEKIHVKFRPTVWYCQVPVVRQVIDAYSKKCSPIHTAGARGANG
jgi:hypothetical protein